MNVKEAERGERNKSLLPATGPRGGEGEGGVCRKRKGSIECNHMRSRGPADYERDGNWIQRGTKVHFLGREGGEAGGPIPKQRGNRVTAAGEKREFISTSIRCGPVE